jgi:hypothetical protein
VEWLIAAGLHPRAGATTLAVAQDLAARMDYDTGHVRYSLAATARRLGLDESTVKRHVAVLRDLGLLAWVMKGSRTNIRRVLGLAGYAGTATVYAAVIPAVYDHALGHRIVGTGYGARIVVDLRDRRSPVDNVSGGAVDNPASGSCAPPSLAVVKTVDQVQVDGGFNYTSRKRASRSTESISPPNCSSNDDGPRRSPLQVARDIRIASKVRPLVRWTQSEGLRRLAYALRPLVDQGLDVHDIAAELTAWALDWGRWRPARPAAYIRVQLAEQARHAAMRAAAVDSVDNAEWRAMVAQSHAAAASLEALFAPLLERTDADRRTARATARTEFNLVLDHIDDHGLDDAIDLYGVGLVCKADRLRSSNNYRLGW